MKKYLQFLFLSGIIAYIVIPVLLFVYAIVFTEIAYRIIGPLEIYAGVCYVDGIFHPELLNCLSVRIINFSKYLFVNTSFLQYFLFSSVGTVIIFFIFCIGSHIKRKKYLTKD